MYYLTDEDYALAASNGIPRNLAYNRYYNYNYDLKRALTEKVGSYQRKTPNTLLWEEWEEVAKTNGVTKTNFLGRLNSAGKKKWTAEEAAKTPVGNRGTPRTGAKIKPIHYELAEKNGINKSTLQNRVYGLHWNPYRAATEEVDISLNWRAQ